MTTKAKAINLREAILDATDRLLARYGYKKMTIDDLASEVGIGKGSIYLHFRSKEDIALSHIDRIVDHVLVELERIADENAEVSDRLKRMLLARVLIRFDSVQHYTVSINELLAALRPKLLSRRQTYFDKEAEVFARVISSGGVKRAEARKIAESFIAATNSLLPLSLSTKELGKQTDIAKKTSDIADLLINGLSKTCIDN